MNPQKVVYSLISLFWLIGNPLNLLAQPANNGPIIAEQSIRIAVLPFCDESGSTNNILKPDPQVLYNHIFGSLKELYACEKPVEWISKKLVGQSIGTYTSNTSMNSCEYVLTDKICRDVKADIMVMGEFLVNKDGSVDVYYSFENCEGVYASGIEYLTDQPLRLNTENMESMYLGVAEAIQQDLDNFLGCEKGIRKNEINQVAKEGVKLYQLADVNALNYLKSVELFEKILATDPNHSEALYFTGLSYFSLGEYEKAGSYFDKAGNVYAAKEYLTYSQLKSKPAIWYDSHKKRSEWWDNLSAQWKVAFNTQVLELKTDETPSNQELDSLFNLTILTIEDYSLPDLSGLEALTRLTQLNCNKTDLINLKGIEKLRNLGHLSINKNEITSLKEIASLPGLNRIYCQNNPLESLEGIESLDASRAVIFCKGSVSGKEMKRIKALGFEVMN